LEGHPDAFEEIRSSRAEPDERLAGVAKIGSQYPGHLRADNAEDHRPAAKDRLYVPPQNVAFQGIQGRKFLFARDE
jgi:hypothetical protein